MEIVTNIPMPSDTRAGRKAIYPFADMSVGSSFSMDAADRARLTMAAKQWARRHPGWKYVIRQTEDKVRIWRKT